MDYRKARSYIDEAHRFGGEMGLDVITRFLEYLGNPQDDLRFVHIAGTNGKGSVGAYLEAVLVEAGYRVGRFISPTLYEYRERIQINGAYITEEDFGRWMDQIVPVMEKMKREGEALPSPFEIETALSFLYRTYPKFYSCNISRYLHFIYFFHLFNIPLHLQHFIFHNYTFIFKN